MPWIKVHHSIREHRKIISAAEELRIREPQMIGHLCLLWLWAMENSTTGRLDVSDALVARISDWTKPPKPFVTALINANLLQRDFPTGLIVVNFDEHILPVIIAANKNRQRTMESRMRTGETDSESAAERKEWPGKDTWT